MEMKQVNDRIKVPDSAILADGLNEAVIGYMLQNGRYVAVYEYQACVDVFVDREGWPRDEAIEWMEYNVVTTIFDGSPFFIDFTDTDID